MLIAASPWYRERWGIYVATGQAQRRRTSKSSEKPEGTASERAKRGRAEYVIQCIRDQPWLDGKRTRLIRLLIDRFGGGERTARAAVLLAEQWLDEEREQNIPKLVGFLDRVHRHTIEMGQRTGDGRIITPAAAELRKLHGIGEPDRVQLSGAVQSGLSADAAALLGALKLTNAQRLAEIDKLEAEIAEAEQRGGDPDQPAVVSGADVTEGINHGTQEPDSYEDDDE